MEIIIELNTGSYFLPQSSWWIVGFLPLLDIATLSALIFLLSWVQCQAPCCEELTLASGRPGWNKSGGLGIKSILSPSSVPSNFSLFPSAQHAQKVFYHWHFPPRPLEVRPVPSHPFFPLRTWTQLCRALGSTSCIPPGGAAAAEAGDFVSRGYTGSYSVRSIAWVNIRATGKQITLILVNCIWSNFCFMRAWL